MIFEAPKNPNYAATVVTLSTFADLPNCDNVKAALIFGNSVIVAKDTPKGQIGLFFPVECALSAEFLSNNNLYRKAEFGNIDQSKTGFFEQHGRVKAMKFRGHKSEGFFIPIDSLNYLHKNKVLVWHMEMGQTFDHFDGHEICRKYIPRGQKSANSNQTKGKTAKLEDSIVDGQFRFHYDTENLRRNAHRVKPTDFISITDKWHGTSVVLGNLLVKRKLSFGERLLKRIGVQIMDSTYGLTYSSRRVIKAVNGVTKDSNHFYIEDIWGVVAKEVQDRIPAGFTVYGEIVGYTPDGTPIQQGYPYGCEVGSHKFVVYRVTLTTAEGKTVELNWPQVIEFCEKQGFGIVPTLWQGFAKDVFPNLDESLHWADSFVSKLEETLVQDGDCSHNPPKTPAEGICLRIDRLHESETFKLKNFRFLEAESKLLDKGVVDTETAQSEVVDDPQPSVLA